MFVQALSSGVNHVPPNSRVEISIPSGVVGKHACAVVAQLCLTLVHGILQARTLEWIAMPSSKGCSPARDQIRISCSGEDSLPAVPLENTFYPYLVDRKEYGAERL